MWQPKGKEKDSLYIPLYVSVSLILWAEKKDASQLKNKFFMTVELI